MFGSERYCELVGGQDYMLQCLVIMSSFNHSMFFKILRDFEDNLELLHSQTVFFGVNSWWSIWANCNCQGTDRGVLKSLNLSQDVSLWKITFESGKLLPSVPSSKVMAVQHLETLAYDTEMFSAER